MRAAQASDGTVGTALDHTEGLTQAEAEEVEVVREVLARAAKVADRSVLDAFRVLWQELPYSSRLVGAAGHSTGAGREIDVVVGLSSVVADAGTSSDTSDAGVPPVARCGRARTRLPRVRSRGSPTRFAC